MKITIEIKIEKAINDVWQVMGNDFAGAAKWSTNFQTSKPFGEKKFEGLDYSGRETTTDRGLTIQVLDKFEPQNYSLEYHITEGIPPVGKSASSHWYLKEDGEGTKAIFDYDMELKDEVPAEMVGKIEMGLKMGATQLAEELKAYVEGQN